MRAGAVSATTTVANAPPTRATATITAHTIGDATTKATVAVATGNAVAAGNAVAT